jgi:hypothetical protein
MVLFAGILIPENTPDQALSNLPRAPTGVLALHPNTPSKASLPPQKEKKRNLCVRYNLLPMSRVAHH